MAQRKQSKSRDRKRRPDSERRVRQSVRVARVLRLLELLQSRGKRNASELARTLECSVRTIHRDLGVLELVGIPWEYVQKDGSYRIAHNGFCFPVLNLTDEELIGQAVATALADAPGLNIGAGAAPATRKIGATSGERTRQTLDAAGSMISVLNLKLGDISQHRQIIRTVQQALIECRQLAGEYRSPYEPAAVQLKLHPYRLALIKEAWYLIARPTDENEARTYRISRFTKLTPLTIPADVPKDFNLKAYFGKAWGVYRGKKVYSVEIMFAADVAGVVTETKWHTTQQVHQHDDGSVTLNFEVAGLPEIANWIMRWSDQAKVIKPPELQRLIRERLKTALARNGTDTATDVQAKSQVENGREAAGESKPGAKKTKAGKRSVG